MFAAAAAIFIDKIDLDNENRKNFILYDDDNNRKNISGNINIFPKKKQKNNNSKRILFIIIFCFWGY